MRKNLAKHAAKKLPLAKRVLALCFALIFVCSCLLPAFANGADADFTEDTPAVVEEVAEPVDVVSEEPTDTADDGLATLDDDFGVATLDEDFGVATLDEGFGVDDSFGVDDGLATLDDGFAVDSGVSSLDENPISQPVGGIDLPIAIDPTPVVDGDDTPKEGAVNVTTDKDGNIVYEYDTSDVTFDDDFVVSQPDGDHALDKVDAAFAIPTNTYRFWLSEKDSYDLAEIARDAAAADLTEDEYLRLHGESKGLFHLMYVADGGNLADYKFTSPTSVDDPSGNSRTFAGWYTIDELGDKHDFKFDDFLYTSKSQTVDVYAKWKKNVDYSIVYQNVVDSTDSQFEELAEKYSEDEDCTAYLDKLDEEQIEPFLSRVTRWYADNGASAVYALYSSDVATYADTADYTINVGETVTLTTPSGYRNGYWSSSNSNVASVRGNVVTGKAAGTVEISYYYTNNSWWTPVKTYVVRVRDSRTATFKPSIEHATVLTVHYAGTESSLNKDTLISELKEVTGEFTTSWDHGEDNYWLFFVKPDDNYLITGLGASGTNGMKNDIYSINGPYTNITNYPHLTALVAKAKEMGYVGVFGYSRSTSDSSSFGGASFTVVGEQPGLEVRAECDKTVDVKPGDELEFTVTIIPGYTSGKPSDSIYKGREKVTDVDITSLTINGVEYPYSSLIDNGDGTYTTKVKYTATADDCASGSVRLDVKASVEYEVNVNVQDSQNVPTYSTIKNDAQTTCAIAPQNDVNYVTTINVPDGITITNYPDKVIARPIDSTHYYKGNRVEADKEYPGSEVVDTANGGVWTFDGWYLDDTLTTETVMGEEPLTFTGTWTFTRKVTTLTVSKKVTGLLGDRHKEFEFTVDFGSADTSNIEYSINGSENVKWNGTTITLKHNDTVVFYNVPYNANVRVSEAVYDDYTTTYEYYTTDGEKTEPLNGNEVLAEMDGAKTIDFTNDCTIEPDMGVLLDTLPYILILGVVVGGAVLLFVRKRKHDDE